MSVADDSPSKYLVRISKMLSKTLRHDPGRVGITLDAGGWADVDQLIAAFNAKGQAVDRPTLEQVVRHNDKQRFAFSEDGRRIRANQGHSIEVDLGLEPVEPPEILYHGTATRNVASIQEQGLLPGGRQHVHLSPDKATAIKVGQRHGKPVVFAVRSGALHGAGHTFFKSANGVWLTDRVPTAFLELIQR